MKDNYSIHIKAKTGWFDVDLKELFQYKDLILLFVKRNYVTRYKQTILGPLWLILNPLITVLLYSFVFGNIAGMSTDGSPQLAFYMASNSLWSYFALCINQTSTTFSANAAVFGKVYFPRLTTPISTVLTGMLDLAIQVGMLLVTILIYNLLGTPIKISSCVFLAPLVVVEVALLGLGCGIIVSSLTTKYRDLSILVSFGVSLWMYISPVVYSVSQISEKQRFIYMLNPIAPMITVWRHAFLGVGEIPYISWGISWVTTIIVLAFGILIFCKIEKTFMDTV